MATVNCWWITASEESEQWHWDKFFDKPREPYNAEWHGIESSVSRKRIKEMRRGDVVVAYQAGEGVVGFARLESDGQQCDGGIFDAFRLAAVPRLRLNNAVPYARIRELPGAKDNFEFVRIAKQGTVFRVTRKGLKDIVVEAEKLNRNQAPAIQELLES